MTFFKSFQILIYGLACLDFFLGGGPRPNYKPNGKYFRNHVIFFTLQTRPNLSTTSTNLYNINEEMGDSLKFQEKSNPQFM